MIARVPLVAACLVLVLAAPAAAKPKVYGTVARADAAAAREVYQPFFELDPKLNTSGSRITFKAGCRRLTARAFRCDWAGENPDYYSAAGTVRVTFKPFGVDAVLAAGSTCAPEGNVYDTTGLSECP